MRKVAKLLFVALGFLAFVVGTVGIVLPVLPTTPLYLLAAFCFAKGSTRFHAWFTGTGLYKKYLDSFVRSRAMTLKSKLAICIPVSIFLTALLLLTPIWYAKAVIAGALLFKWCYFIFRIKTLPASTVSSKVDNKANNKANRKRGTRMLDKNV